MFLLSLSLSLCLFPSQHNAKLQMHRIQNACLVSNSCPISGGFFDSLSSIHPSTVSTPPPNSTPLFCLFFLLLSLPSHSLKLSILLSVSFHLARPSLLSIPLYVLPYDNPILLSSLLSLSIFSLSLSLALYLIHHISSQPCLWCCVAPIE